MNHRLSVLFLIMVVLVGCKAAAQEALSPEPTDAPELTIISNGMPSLFAYSDEVINWEEYENNILSIEQVIEYLPISVQEATAECGAEYAQVGKTEFDRTYVNIFCSYFLDNSENATTPRLLNEYFVQSAIDHVEDEYFYVGTFYSPAYYKNGAIFSDLGSENEDGLIIAIGLPFAGEYPVIGEISEDATFIQRGDRDMLRREIASYFTSQTGQSIAVEDMTYREELSAFEVNLEGEYYYYPVFTHGSIELRKQIPGCQDNRVNYGDWFICQSPVQLSNLE